MEKAFTLPAPKMVVDDCIKLGFGLMRLPREGGEASAPIDIEQSKLMVDEFIAAGGKYFDTAFIYEGSEDATRQALCERYPRDAYYLATKLNASNWAAPDEEAAKAQLRKSIERTGAGYIDFYLLHGLEEGNLETFDQYGIWDFVQEAKAEGLIKHAGFSFHDNAELLDQILTAHPEAEFVQLQINYADWEDGIIQSRAIYEVAMKHGKPVVVMEPVKGGTLAKLPPQVEKILRDANPDASPASWALRFVASLPGVMSVLSGMSSIEQMRDNLSSMKDFKPLTEEEHEVVNHAREALNAIERIPCTACHYCTPGCPAGIHIPEIFTIMNEYKMYGDLERSKSDYGWRPKGARASECIQCGQCEDACPQHLPIISLLEEVVQAFE